VSPPTVPRRPVLHRSPVAWGFASAVLAAAALACLLLQAGAAGGICATAALAALAMAAKLSKHFAPLAFTVVVVGCVAGAIFFPEPLTSWAGPDPSRVIGPRVFAPLLQLIMFGMGMTLTFADFGRVLRMPRPVVIGFMLQFTVMPLLAVACVKLFSLQGEVASGLILYGACSGGTASNVIAYLARGNVALSVTMTSFSTLAAPVMTPLAMKLLAGAHLDVDPWNMTVAILKMIVVPVLLGLLVNRFIHDRIAWALRWLPLVAMAAICVIIGLTVAMARDEMLRYGAVLLAAAVCHNAAGYLLGYGAARVCRLNVVDCRTVAIEVGMQNGGMASTLAHTVLHSEAAALASAVEGPWSAVAGSFLASIWRKTGRRPSSATADAPPKRVGATGS